MSFSIRKLLGKVVKHRTTKGASVLFFFGFHCSFAGSSEPSGKGLPLLPRIPFLERLLIMIGLATITFSTSSVRAEETTDQSSYPPKSENAMPLGDFSRYLSCFERGFVLAA